MFDGRILHLRSHHFRCFQVDAELGTTTLVIPATYPKKNYSQKIKPGNMNTTHKGENDHNFACHYLTSSIWRWISEIQRW